MVYKTILLIIYNFIEMCVITTVILHFYIPGTNSLKEKRSIIRPIIHRLHRKFNISISEIEKLDIWDEAILMYTHVSNNKGFSQSYVQKINAFIQKYFNNVDLIDSKIEYL